MEKDNPMIFGGGKDHLLVEFTLQDTAKFILFLDETDKDVAWSYKDKTGNSQTGIISIPKLKDIVKVAQRIVDSREK